jgi:hypothetical protein
MNEHALIYYVRVATSAGTQACRQAVISGRPRRKRPQIRTIICASAAVKKSPLMAQIVSDRRALDANNEAELPVDAASALWLRVNMPTTA